MEMIDTKRAGRPALRGVAWAGKAALFCLGLLAMLALVVVTGVLAVVMLAATVLPAPAVGRSRGSGDRRVGPSAQEFSATRKALVP